MFKDILYIKRKNWFPIVLFNLCIVSLSGLLLRAFHYTAIPYLDYSNLLEAHSHFAFGGWGFMALFIGLHHAFLNKKVSDKSYAHIFLVALISVWGMLLSFPFHGYAAVSTAFATSYIWVTYWFAIRFYRDTKNEKPAFSLKIAKAALIFLVLSSIGPYTMAAIMALGHGGDPRAMNAIYFYLHFQYNGWFIFGILALFFKWMEWNRIQVPERLALRFYHLLFWSCFPAVLLSFLWSKPGKLIFWIAGLAGLVQLIALIPLIQIIRYCRKRINIFINSVGRFMGIFVLVMFSLKYLFEFLGSFSVIVNWTITIRNLLIAYLHLVFLGVFTLFLITYFIQAHILKSNKITYSGLWLFFTGFFITEVFLFSASSLSLFNSYIPSFNSWMFFTTILLPLGAVLLWVGNLNGGRPKDFNTITDKIQEHGIRSSVKEV